MATNLDKALAQARLDRYVFPCREKQGEPYVNRKGKTVTPDIKQPYTKHGMKNATTNEGVIRAWWLAYPGALVGINLKMSGLVCVDVDTHKEKENGYETLDGLIEKRGNGEPLPDQCHQHTISGGMHRLYKDPGDVVFPGRLGSGVDVKYDGYICTGTLADGRAYQGNIEEEAPELPGWIADMAREIAQEEERNKEQTKKQTVSLDLSDVEIVEKLRTAANGDKFERLYYGGDVSGYPSHSEADLGLCSMIAFYANGEAQTDRIFRSSKLYREDKWGDRDDYRVRTLAKASNGEHYHPGLHTNGRNHNGKQADQEPPEVNDELPPEPGEEIPQAVQPAPRGADGKEAEKRRVLSAEYVQAVKDLGYVMRMCELDQTIEVNGQPLSDALEAEIRSKLRDAGYPAVNVARDAWIADAWASRYHPIKDYLDGLQWDGYDHILDLACHFTDKDGLILIMLKKFLVGAIARVYRNGVQNRVLVLKGLQDLGKSYFVRWLASGLGGKYYIDAPINPDDKDDRIRLTNTWVWEIGELESTTGRRDVNALKHFLSRETVQERAPYGRNDLIRPALTSFIATTNDNAFLHDATGNRRFAVCNLTAIDWDYATTIDVNQVWAQAKALYDAGEPWRYTGDEKEMINEINSQYEAPNPVICWLDETICPDEGGKLATVDILAELRTLGAKDSDKSLMSAIADYMRANKYEEKRVDIGRDADGKRLQGRRWIGAAIRRSKPQ